MITAETLMNAQKDELTELSTELTTDDIEFLVEWLSDKDDKLRYPTFLVLQQRAKASDELYKYWEVFKDKLASENSYQRSIGLIMLAANAKWDKDGRFEECFEDFCAMLNDEKPITVRQCIQSFADIVPYKQGLNIKIAERLMAIDVINAKETMRKLFLLDTINILLLIRKTHASDDIEKYISDALTGGILDNKSKKAIQAAL